MTTPPLTTQGREVAQKALEERRTNQPEQIDNASLPAGSSMYYYCVSCGHLADVKPEGWWMTLPNKLCTECEAMKEMGWLDD